MGIDFQTEPSKYRHWRIERDGEVADLIMDVDEKGGLHDGYDLKLNSYDLSVDIELYDAIQRLRFEHPEVKVVVLRSGKDNIFCAGANIRMLAGASHAHKVNFCKFTNETRNSIEDASENSRQKYIAAVTGACAGGGYSNRFWTPRFSWQSRRMAPTWSVGVRIIAVMIGSSSFAIRPASGSFAGLSIS